MLFSRENDLYKNNNNFYLYTLKSLKKHIKRFVKKKKYILSLGTGVTFP